MWRVLVVLAWATTLPSMASGSGGEPWARAEIASEVPPGYSPWRGGVRLRVHNATVSALGISLQLTVEGTPWIAAAVFPGPEVLDLDFFDTSGRHLFSYTVLIPPNEARELRGGKATISVDCLRKRGGEAYLTAELFRGGLKTKRLRLKSK